SSSRPGRTRNSQITWKAKRSGRARVRDAIDRARFLVRDEQRAVGQLLDVGGTAPGPFSLPPTLRERMIGDGLSVLHLDEGDPIADLLAAVPGSVFGDEDLAAVLLREHG